jgi:hypothetical protein
MPSPEFIPEINDDSSIDERDATHGIMSDDDTTLVDQEYFPAVKGSSEARPMIPALPENKFERPISPPATPPMAPRVADVVPDEKFGLDEEPTKADKVVEKATEMTVKVVEEAAKAVEEHKAIVEDANKPAEAEEPNLNEVASMSEFVIVFEPEVEAPVAQEEPAKRVEAVSSIEEVAPVVEEVAPVVEEAAPIIEDVAPVVEKAAPVVEEPAPVVEPTPVIEEPTPAVIDSPAKAPSAELFFDEPETEPAGKPESAPYPSYASC